MYERDRYQLTLKTAPTEEPVGISAVKRHLKCDDTVTEDDDLIFALTKAAREASEAITNRALVKQTWTMKMDCLPCEIRVPKPPLRAVNSIKYLDTDGNQQTLASTEYLVDKDSEPGRIVPAYGKSWPSTRYQPNAIEVEIEVGYENAAKVPFSIKAAMLTLVGHLYEHRESVNISNIVTPVDQSFEYLLYPYRVLNV